MNDQRRGGNGHTTTADLDVHTSELRSRVAGIGLAINELRHETERLRAAAASRQGAITLLEHVARGSRSDESTVIDDEPAFDHIVAHIDDEGPESDHLPLAGPIGIEYDAAAPHPGSEPATVWWIDDAAPLADDRSLTADSIAARPTPVRPADVSSQRALVEWIDDDNDAAVDAGFVDSLAEADLVESAVDPSFVAPTDPDEEVLAWVAPTAPGTISHPEAPQPPAPPWKDAPAACAAVAPAASEVSSPVSWDIPAEVEPSATAEYVGSAADEAVDAIEWPEPAASGTAEALVAATPSAAPVELAPAGTPWEPLDDEAEAAFDRFFSAAVEPEPAQRWLLSD